MKKIYLLIFVWITSVSAYSQGVRYFNYSIPAKDKGKAIKYNAFGMGVYPSEHLMVGGNHVSYRKFGFGMSWRLGIQNIIANKEGYSSIEYDTAAKNGWLTGKTRTNYSFGANLNFVFPITKKIPVYFGAGVIRERKFGQILPPYLAPGQEEWQINPNETKFVFNFGGGIFIPVAGRLVLNLGYDHLPQTFFVGLAISGPFNYEDMDMW